MTLTSEQYDSLLASYIEQIVDGMDLDSLIQFASEQIELNLRENCSLDVELVDEICSIYDDEIAADLLESVGANPADFDINTESDNWNWAPESASVV